MDEIHLFRIWRTFMAEKHDYQRFKPKEIARSFPETAETLLIDTYLTDEAAASARVFRVYRETPPHYHAGCAEYLYVLSGRGTFWMGDASNGGEFAPGDLLSSSATSFMLCPKFLRSRWSFSRSTHRDATRKTSSSSTLRTARRKALSEEKNNEICTLSISRVARHPCRWVYGGSPRESKRQA
jgi:mannose-6-phosphate isomerase-like protein (cupin superfamily)